MPRKAQERRPGIGKASRSQTGLGSRRRSNSALEGNQWRTQTNFWSQARATMYEVPGAESTVRGWWRRLCSMLSDGSDSVPGRGRRKLLVPLAREPRTYPSWSPWFPDLQQRLRAPPGASTRAGRRRDLGHWSPASRPPRSSLHFLEAAEQRHRARRPPARAPPRCPSSSLSLRARELRRPGATRWQVSGLTSYPRARSLLSTTVQALVSTLATSEIE